MVRTADRVVRSPRIAERRREVRAQKRRRRRRIIITLIVVAGIASGAWIMMRSSVFSLQKIDVVGAVSLSKQEIVDASGLHVGQRGKSGGGGCHPCTHGGSIGGRAQVDSGHRTHQSRHPVQPAATGRGASRA